jgi:hypothetical protein
MNKRQMKKRRKLRSISVGDHTYTHKEIEMVDKLHIRYTSMHLFYPKIKRPKLTRPRVKALINYLYKNKMEYISSLSFEPIFFEDLDDCKPIMKSHGRRFNIL